jgi:aromatic ring-opening dioxygenase LigB subunit
VIVRVAVVPHPPLLIPEIAAGAAVETAALREACLVAAGALAQRCPRWVAVAAVDPTAVTGAAGSFAGYGADVDVALCPEATAADRVELPLPLLIAGWLRGQVGAAHVSVAVCPVPPGSSTAQCRRIGNELAQRLRRNGDSVGLLVLGDGAATHTLRAPGYLDSRAHRLDASVAEALAAANSTALLDLDAALAAELLVAGREAWQVGAAAAQSLAPAYQGELLYSAAPYGVAYHVALWDAVSPASVA